MLTSEQPTIAKLMDVFGRFEVLAVSIVFYVIGVSFSHPYEDILS